MDLVLGGWKANLVAYIYGGAATPEVWFGGTSSTAIGHYDRMPLAPRKGSRAKNLVLIRSHDSYRAVVPTPEGAGGLCDEK